MVVMNWVDLIALLQDAGYTQTEIAQECGCAQNTISDLATGKTKRPNFDIGKCLERLAAKAKLKLARQNRSEEADADSSLEPGGK
jgi:transcriptional regulator with XRE-family HTH domain